MRSTRRGLAARTVGSAAAVALVAAGLAVSLSASPAQAAGGTGTGYLSTKGNQIVDSTGATVRITGINWFGMETDNHTFHGLWSDQSWTSQIDNMAALGFNTLRIPYSNDNLNNSLTPSVNAYSNPDLAGAGPMDILDKVINYAYSKGMRSILDRHRPTAAGQSPLWYIPSVPESKWISDWEMLAKRYAGNPAVIGADLHNEPHAMGTSPAATGACWGCGDPARDWRLAAERAGNAIHAVNPNWLIFVEGVFLCPTGGDNNVWDNDTSNDVRCGWWGGNLSQAEAFPVRLKVPNKLVYSPHEYATSVYKQTWFDDPTYPANMPAIWDYFFGDIYKKGIAPIMMGEFGSTLADPRDAVWLKELMAYLGTGSTGMSFTYWSWNPNSGDTGGVVADDWKTVNQTKYGILKPYLSPPAGSGTISPTTTTTRPTSTTPTTTTTRPTSTTPTTTTTRPTSTTPTTTTTRPTSTTPTTTTTRPTSTAPTSTGACTVTVKIDSSWPGGFQASVSVKNTTSSSLNPWSLAFTVPSGTSIQSGWNGTYTASGTTITVAAPSWATSLGAGATASLGFVGNGSSNPVPSAFKLNGAACS